MTLPAKVQSLLKRSGKKPVKFVLFRLPKDFDLKDMNGAQLDLSDLKVSSVCGKLSAIPDLHTNPDRASACPLVESDDGHLRCGNSFAAHIQIVTGEPVQAIRQTPLVQHVQIKREIEKKSKKVKVQ
jgi:hypothetical protein